MITNRHCLLAAAFCGGLSFLPSASIADDAASMLVLDASGSMWAQLPEGRSKIEVAREVVRDYLTDRDANVPLGVIAYGHNRKGDCSDIETIAPLGMQNAQALADRIDQLSPVGKTPLTDALEQAVQQIPKTAESADVILITDGLETCDRDPCALAREIAAQGIDIRAHVVGFGLSKADVNTLSCIPEETGGQLLSPQSGRELADALRVIEQEKIVEPEVTKPAVLPVRVGLVLAEGTVWPSDLQYQLQRLDGDEEQVITLPPIENSGEARDYHGVDIPSGKWRITAKSSVGGGEIVVDITQAVDIDVPFSAEIPDYELLNLGTFQPLRAEDLESHLLLVKQNDVKQWNKTLYIYVLPEGAQTYEAAVYWNYLLEEKPGTYQIYADGLSEPGRYRVVISEYRFDATKPIYAEGQLSIQSGAAVQVKLPEQNAINQAIPMTIEGDLYSYNRVQVYRGDDQLVDVTISDLVSEKGFALPPIDQAGQYELHYLYNDERGERIVLKVPFAVGESVAPSSTAKAPASEAGKAAADSSSDANTHVNNLNNPSATAADPAAVPSGAHANASLELLMGDVVPGGELTILWTGPALPGDQLVLAPSGSPDAPVWTTNADTADNPLTVTLPNLDFEWAFYYLSAEGAVATLPLQ